MDVSYLDLRAAEHRAQSPFFMGSIDAIGVDLRAYLPFGVMVANPWSRIAIPCGFAIEIPKPFYGRVAPRSGLAYKTGIDVLAGVVDSDYRGEIKVIMMNLSDDPFVVHDGDRVAQMIMEAAQTWVPKERDALSETARQEKGWGSSGVK